MQDRFTRRHVLGAGGSMAAAMALGLPKLGFAQGKTILNAAVANDTDIIACGVSTFDSPQSISGGKILQPLIRYDENQKLEGVLAESWSVSDDGKVYTFNLRPNVRWHDGKAFTADDVVFGLDQILRKTNARTRSALEHAVSIEKTGDLTVVITLDAPYRPFLTALNSINAPILPKHLYEGTEFRQNPVNLAPVGTGPFKFAEWRRAEYVKLVRNEDYWGAGEPHVDEIYFHFIPDSAQRTIAMETGRLDVALRQVISPTDVRRLVAAGKAKLVDARAYDGLGALSLLELNHRREPFGNRLVRQAMLHALDRQLIIDAAFLGEGKVPAGPIASGTLHFDRDANVTYDYDPDKARSLLDEAGLKPNGDGVRASFKVMVANANSERQRMMEIIKQQFAEVGLDAQLEYVDGPTLNATASDWDYDIQFRTVGQFQDPSIGVARQYLTARIQHAAGSNTAGYSNPRVDTLWAEADAALTEAAAQKAYSEIQHILSEDAAQIWLLEVQDNLLVATNVDGLYQGPLSAYYSWAEVTKS